MFALPAALHFYRALRVYPSPVELIMIYEKTVPEPVFKVGSVSTYDPYGQFLNFVHQIIMDLTNLDVSSSTPSFGLESSESHEIALEEDETSPERGGPPSEASSQDWDKLTDPGSVSAA